MQKLTPLITVILSAVAISGHAGEKQKVFKYSSQLGVAEVSASGDGCLAIPNSTLRENQLIKLVILGKQQTVVEKRIVKKLETSCSRNPQPPPDASFYAFSTAEEHFDPAIAVVGFTGDLKLVKGKVRADLNGDGTTESFRSCTSNEGLHLTVWAGEALKTKRLWHEYYYLGFDIEPSCKPADYDFP
ncbi:MAG: hypothetical protein HYS23_04560 [Geobacter sp.]|nr:hypothetical protein [Geobacter sp.]